MHGQEGRCDGRRDTQRLRDELYVDAETADGYLRDACVYREDIDIFDTMNAVVKYSTGVNMSYSVKTFMPIGGTASRSTGRKGDSKCATTSARRGIRAKRARCT